MKGKTLQYNNSLANWLWLKYLYKIPLDHFKDVTLRSLTADTPVIEPHLIHQVLSDVQTLSGRRKTNLRVTVR